MRSITIIFIYSLQFTMRFELNLEIVSWRGQKLEMYEIYELLITIIYYYIIYYHNNLNKYKNTRTRYEKDIFNIYQIIAYGLRKNVNCIDQSHCCCKLMTM